jgi:uncharacterized protein DUF3575
MRRSSVIALFTTATIAVASAGAQSALVPAKATVLSIQPLSAVFGVYSAEVEHAVSPTVTLGVGASYWNFDDDFSKTTYTSGDVKLRYYPEAKPFRGFSLGGQVGYTSLSDKTDEDVFGGSDETKASGPTIGVALDYGWLLGATRSFYVGLGLGAKKIFAKDDDFGDAKFSYPTARISIGYAF